MYQCFFTFFSFMASNGKLHDNNNRPMKDEPGSMWNEAASFKSPAIQSEEHYLDAESEHTVSRLRFER
jgi:hypothetical protein